MKDHRGSAHVPIPVVLIVLVIAVGVAGVLVVRAARGPGDSTTSAATESVGYFVTGAGQAALTIATPTGNTQLDAWLPVANKEGTPGLHLDFASGSFLYLSAQNRASDPITCRIEVDGVTVSENTATGQYNIATCEGRF